MKRYLGVKAVKEKGELFFEYKKKTLLSKGTRIIAILSSGTHERVIDVTKERDCTDAFNSAGYIVKRFYTLSQELVKECPDEGWVLI